MKDHVSISWIGEEIPSSRDHIGQGEERTKSYTGGVQQKKATGKSQTAWIVSYELSVHMHGS